MKTKVIIAALATSTVLTLAVLFLLWSQMTGQGERPLAASLENTASLGQDNAGDGHADAGYDLGAHLTLSRVIVFIREHYVEPERVDAYKMFEAALDNIERTIPEVIIDESGAPERVVVSAGRSRQSFALGHLDQLWEVTMALRDIFRFLQRHIDDADTRRNVEYAAINGMLSTLDPHSILLEPKNFDEMKLSTKGEFGGLGIVISIRDGSLTVMSPIEGTPASRAGLKAKDKIVRIGEESTVNMALDEAVSRLRGKPGTDIDIWVSRPGWKEPRKFVLTRAIIKIESVTSELLSDGIGYIRIKSFQGNTYDDLDAHLAKLRRKNTGRQIKGLVLDLRNNPGGLLDQAIHISDRFIDDGALVITVGEGARKREEKRAHYAGTDRDYPIAVLVNGGSASASEIVSGALKNHDRAVVIGQQTFGKGSVQVLYDFKDHSALKLTIAQYLTPGDVSIQSVGISPDVEIRPVALSDERVHLFASDESPREKDLDRHLEQHFESERAKREAPAVTLLNIIEDDPEEEEPVDEAVDAFKMDFDISLARDVVKRAKSPDRKAMMRAAKGIFDARKKAQNIAITDALKKLGVDWSRGDSPGAKVEVELSVLLKTGEKTERPLVEPTAVKAGESLILRAVAINKGKNSVSRVYGVSDSDNPLLDNLEFAFGRIEAGARRHWDVEVKVPDDFISRADEISVKLENESKEVSGLASAMLRIEAANQPRFAFQYSVDDSLSGNGDGIVQVGEEVQLRLRVKNVGEGDAAEPVLTVKNATGPELYLNRGRAKLDALKAGDSAEGEISFSLKHAVEELKMKVTIWDSKVGSTLTEAVKIPSGDAKAFKTTPQKFLKFSKATQVLRSPKAEEIVIANLPSGSAVEQSALSKDGWGRVNLGSGLLGFVSPASMKGSKKARRASAAKVQNFAHWISAPALDIEPESYVTVQPTLMLKGNARDDGALKDIYVFVNEKKVHYAAWDKKSSGAEVKQDIALSVPLEEGSNTVVVVVRENDEVSSRKFFGVYRQASKGLAATTGAP